MNSFENRAIEGYRRYRAFFSDKNNYFSMRFNVTTEDVGEYLCNVQSNSNDEGEDQSMINVIDGEY